MRIYLGMCCIQRPLDDRSQARVAMKAEAVLAIIARCQGGQAQLISSVALEYETAANPQPTRSAYSRDLLRNSADFVSFSQGVEGQARALEGSGFKPLDALHIACAVAGRADVFCTCDDRLLRRARSILSGPPKILNPVELVMEYA